MIDVGLAFAINMRGRRKNVRKMGDIMRAISNMWIGVSAFWLGILLGILCGSR